MSLHRLGLLFYVLLASAQGFSEPHDGSHSNHDSKPAERPTSSVRNRYRDEALERKLVVREIQEFAKVRDLERNKKQIEAAKKFMFSDEAAQEAWEQGLAEAQKWNNELADATGELKAYLALQKEAALYFALGRLRAYRLGDMPHRALLLRLSLKDRGLEKNSVVASALNQIEDLIDKKSLYNGPEVEAAEKLLNDLEALTTPKTK